MIFSMPLKCPITTLSVVVEFTVVLELLPTLSFQIGERGGNHRTRSGDQVAITGPGLEIGVGATVL